METLGGRIEKAMKEAGMQQRQLARRIGITDSAMSRYISDERKPQPDVIANIATALHVTSDYLLGIDPISFNGKYVKRIIARDVKNMDEDEKKELIKIILGVD